LREDSALPVVLVELLDEKGKALREISLDAGAESKACQKWDPDAAHAMITNKARRSVILVSNFEGDGGDSLRWNLAVARQWRGLCCTTDLGGLSVTRSCSLTIAACISGGAASWG
jgi:hypothetical protein